MDLDLFDNFTDSGPPTSVVTTLPVSNRKRVMTASAEADSNPKKSIKTDNTERGFQDFSTSSSTEQPSQPNATTTNKKPPAKVYKFQLDGFQREAIGYIDNDESVLVAAHTSAGKTAVAEYAIAKSLRDKQRVIYTSPIKALSNQKFRDLQEEFGDIGLMTGDMTINPQATCLIMTTEILRSMLYRGSEVVREVAWVIYDEVHYMRDKERGVVWEESIILLPHKVRFVFLSATIPNAPAFVSWVSKIHHQPCHVVYTDYRPTPLQHYIFPNNAEGLYLVVDEKSKFREDNFQRAMATLQQQVANDFSAEGNGTSGKSKLSRKQITKNFTNDLLKIVNLIMQRALDPCIIFSFSKKDCELYALQMSKMDFNSPDEHALVEQVFNNAIEALSEEDKTLPQITSILPLLKRGVGIHHGGLLPIIKEVIEILFQEGLLKILFATETFSIGINMPAKTVVFTSTRKFDGKDFRYVSSGEYIQMSGRAGRRGKDDKGIVIQMVDEKMEPDVIKNMIYGQSDPLFSSYHISYNMCLNMMRVEGSDPEKLIKCSFHQFQQEQNSPKLLLQATELEKEAANISIEQEELIEEFMQVTAVSNALAMELNRIVMQPQFVLPFLQVGRLLAVHYEGVEWGWGTILGARKLDQASNTSTILSSSDHAKNKSKPSSNNLASYDSKRWIGSTAKQLLLRQQQMEEHERDDEVEVLETTQSSKKLSQQPVYYLDVLLEVKVNAQTLESNAKAAEQTVEITPSSSASNAEFIVVHVALDAIKALSAIRLNVPNDLSKPANKLKVQNAVKEVLRRFSSEEIPLLDPVQDFGVNREMISELLEKQREIDSRLRGDERYQTIMKDAALMEKFKVRQALLDEAAKFRAQAKELQSVTMREELKKRKKVLRRLEYVTADYVLTSKGRFACELSAGDELVLTNMVFAGVFNNLSVQQTVALLSCFVQNESGSESANAVNSISSGMQKPYRQLQTIAREIAKVCLEVKLISDEQEYLQSFDPALIDVCFAWSNNASFVEVCKMTDVFEGSIIRCLRRLEELLRQLATASQAIGNSELVDLFSEGAKSIRRGVVFAASLYI